MEYLPIDQRIYLGQMYARLLNHVGSNEIIIVMKINNK